MFLLTLAAILADSPRVFWTFLLTLADDPLDYSPRLLDNLPDFLPRFLIPFRFSVVSFL